MDFLKLLNINSIVEVNCGLKDEQNLYSESIFYTGLSADKEIILQNQLRFRFDKSKIFFHFDAVKEPLPKVDLIILNNLAFSKKNNWLLLSNIKESNAKYLLVEKDVAIALSRHPYYLPKSEIMILGNKSSKTYALYQLEKIAFLLDYLPDKESCLRCKMYEYMHSDFEALKDLLGLTNFRHLLISFKNGWKGNKAFIQEVKIKDLLSKNNKSGFKIRDYYYRILYQIECNLVTERAEFINNDNYYNSYLILLNYINFLLLDPIYKI